MYLTIKPWLFDKQGEAKGAGIFPHFAVDNMEALVATRKKHQITMLQEPKTYS